LGKLRGREFASVTYGYSLDATTVGDVSFSKDTYSFLQNGLSELCELLLEWNQREKIPPYKREATDLTRMIEWGPGSSFWALRHPFLNLRGELIECKRTRRLVRIDVLAVPFAAVDEELAVTANQGASPKRNVHSLRNDVAAEHLGRYAWH